MAKHLQTEIDNLKKKILALGGVVEENLRQAVKSVVMRDMKLANEVIEKDGQIDQSEVELEEDCLKILALHQPVAIDLRFIIAVLKINNDLERIGDEAVNIAERGAFLATQKSAGMPVFNYSEMAEKAQFMLRVSLDVTSTSDGRTSDSPGTSRTSSNVYPVSHIFSSTSLLLKDHGCGLSTVAVRARQGHEAYADSMPRFEGGFAGTLDDDVRLIRLVGARLILAHHRAHRSGRS